MPVEFSNALPRGEGKRTCGSWAIGVKSVLLLSDEIKARNNSMDLHAVGRSAVSAPRNVGGRSHILSGGANSTHSWPARRRASTVS